MALDGILLHKYQGLINSELPLKINRITQPSDHEIIFHCFSKQRLFLYISLHAQTNRIQFIDQLDTKNSLNTHFLMLLRKVSQGGKITKIEQMGFDRILKLTILARNDLFEMEETTLVVELMGKYANLILVDKNNKIVDALYRIAPYLNSKRILVPTAPFVDVDGLNKKSPLTYQDEPIDQLMEHFEGFSPQLAREFEYRIKNGENYHELLQKILDSKHLYVAPKKPNLFHAIELKHTGYDFEAFDLNGGLTYIYNSLDHKKRVSDVTNNIEKIIRRELKKSINKKEKLEIEIDKSEDANLYKEYGDYCYMFAKQVNKGDDQLIAQSYEDESILNIPLDPRYNAIENGQLYYKKYQKLMASIPHLEKQINLAQQRIEHLSQLLEQLEYSDVADAIEIKEELAQQGYFFQQKSRKPKQKKKVSLTQIELDADTTIYIGKNNIQNDYLTFNFAAKSNMWFHTRHHHGAHVIVVSSVALSETTIRLAAMLATYYSKARQSSSVEVMYTQVSNLKKIPQAPKGMVNVKQYQSIFIDVDQSMVEAALALSRRT